MSALATTNATLLPNPYTPMAFLPPDIAKKVTVQNYAFVASLAVSGLERFVGII